MLADLLEFEGYAVRQAANGAEALSALVEDRPDLIITDLRMPVMDGFELLRRLPSVLRRPPPVLVVSARYNRAEFQEPHDFLAKPWDVEVLLERVRRLAA
jgi:two-component system response regulator MprA